MFTCHIKRSHLEHESVSVFMKKNSDTQDEAPRGYVRGGPRVHIHTTVSARTRDLLKSLSGETGRINEVIEEAIGYYSIRRDQPDCDDCEFKAISKLLASLVDAADMGLAASAFLDALSDFGQTRYSASEFKERIDKLGTQQTKLLRRLGTVPQEIWENTYEAFVLHVRLLETMGVLRSVEDYSDRRTVMATIKMMRNQPETLLLLLLASWDEAGYTVDVEAIAENKVSLRWVDEREFRLLRGNRDRRIFEAWKNRRERFLMQAGQSGRATLCPPLLEWLATHTINDAIGERTLVSIRDFGPQPDVVGSDISMTILDRVRRSALNVTSSGLLEKCNVTADGDLVRVQVRSRTPVIKDLAIKLIRSLLSLDGIEEMSREEGEATAVLYFGEQHGAGRGHSH